MEKLKFDKEIWIGGRLVSEESPVYIIAEAGVNHNGNVEFAKKMIDEAAGTGVDAVKFQAFRTTELILADVEKAPYQKKVTSADESQYEMLKSLELTEDANEELKDYCASRSITFLTTPFDSISLKEIKKLDLPAIKIAATDLTNIKYLREVAALDKPIILSAGMCYMDEIKKALAAIYPINRKVILLQCTANYPIEDYEVNLKIIKEFQKEFDMLIGYSDHSQGIGASPYAVAMGAKVIEKHFTLSKELEGPDQRASVTVEELKKLVQEIRKVEVYMGKSEKMPTLSESFTRKSLQKYLVAQKEIKKGEIFTEEMITAKRTNGRGITAIYYDDVIGTIADRDYKIDDIIGE